MPQDLSAIAFDTAIDVEAIRARIRTMSDAELTAFGKQMRGLVYPLRYGGDGKPVKCAFSMQLDEARAEWRRRHPKRELGTNSS